MSAALVTGVPDVLPAGAILRGVVRQATAFSWSNPQAVLWLDFRELIDARGTPITIATKVVDVDNAREAVDQNGRILGIIPPRERPSSVEDLVLLAAFLPELFVLESAEYRVREEERPDIEYPAGVDVTLETVSSTPNVPVAIPERPSPPDADLRRLVDTLPTRTTAGKPPRTADVTNLVFLGTELQIRNGFRVAGWTTADALGLRSDVKTILAVAEDRGYQVGPVSQQWLDAEPPDLVFQKQNDTFAKRHHVRIWRWPQTWQGRPVFIGAATHDIGIKFVTKERSFTHTVDARIDLERQRIVDDLRFAGAIEPPGSLERPSVPTRTVNATQDPMQTDGSIAILKFR